MAKSLSACQRLFIAKIKWILSDVSRCRGVKRWNALSILCESVYPIEFWSVGVHFFFFFDVRQGSLFVTFLLYFVSWYRKLWKVQANNKRKGVCLIHEFVPYFCAIAPASLEQPSCYCCCNSRRNDGLILNEYLVHSKPSNRFNHWFDEFYFSFVVLQNNFFQK